MERLFLLSARSRGLPVWVRYMATTLIVVACLLLRLWIFGHELHTALDGCKID